MVERPAEDFCTGVATLLGANPSELKFSALAGGVSSDIWQVDAPGITLCAKRALPQLRVAEPWFAPVERNLEEAKWLRFAAKVSPGEVPEVIAHDAKMGLILLSWYPPSQWQNFKTLLLGAAKTPKQMVTCAEAVGTLLGRVHSASEGDAQLAREFPHFEFFDALRLDPFLRFTASRHPNAAVILQSLIDTLSHKRTCLVHGDVSPKNVLTNNHGDVILLDAECACWGNPAFDVSFMITHLLLKALHLRGERVPDASLALAFWESYRNQYSGGNREPDRLRAVENVSVQLVPALLLARIDGKSPVEYLTKLERSEIRDLSLRYLFQQSEQPSKLPTFINHWCATH